MNNRIFLQDEVAIEIWKNETKSISHWHEETVEIVLALRGTINVQIVGTDYIIKEDELIFVNKWMVHKIEKITEDAIFIILHFNLKFFEKYVKNATKVFFVRNPNLNSEDQLALIRSLIAQIIIVDKKKEEKYEKNIIEISKNLLKMMMKDFNYIEKNPELYRSQESFDRVWIALRFMLDNHSTKISLSRLAEFVHVSDSYLSHCIKKETGKEFEYWLNLFRAENAARLLVSTNVSIVKISDDCGFSDPKYLVKYFKKFFNHLPSEYREINLKEITKHKKDTKETGVSEEENDIIESKMKAYVLGINKINSYLPDAKHLNLEINFSQSGRKFSKIWAEYIDVGDCSNLHKSSYQYFLINAQKEIGFRFALIDFPFDGEDVQISGGQMLFNLQDTFEIYDFLDSISLKPYIKLNSRKYSSGELETIALAFFRNAAELYGKAVLETWRCMIPQKFAGSKTLRNILEDYNMIGVEEEENSITNNYLFDTAYIAPIFIEKVLEEKYVNKNNVFNKLFDDSQINFIGDTGLIANGLKKPLYWAYCVLSLLGEEIIDKGEGYIVTKYHDDLQILVWNSSHSVDSVKIEELNLNADNRYVVFENEKPIKAEININGLSTERYIIKKLLLDRNNGSVFDHLEDSRLVKYLTKREKETLNETCRIRTSYGIANEKKQIYLLDEVPVNGVIMFIITKQKIVGIIK